MPELFEHLTRSLTRAQTLEELTRPLLQLLQEVTGLESTYLTTIDLQASQQHVLYARNTQAQALEIPEGLTVPWHDTLCKRALDEGRPITEDVAGCWADSQAAAALGIQTYASAPVRLSDERLYGTLCAASAARHTLAPAAQHMLGLFARLIAQQIEREQLLHELVQANERLSTYASTDPLTRLPNRRALEQALARQLAQGQRQGTAVLVAFVDLDRFKQINDTHGHDVGDQFLVHIARRLQGVLRAQDLAARHGGDEFVVMGPGPQPCDDVDAARQAFAERLSAATATRFDNGRVALDYAGASVGAVAVLPGTLAAGQALQAADRAMYEVKQARQRGAAAG
ncbi:GGDEF domain-containing protein [Pulveribacter suum]|uniref:Diguanylate cyclase n=1 Tax=Pulveribacter suum TaxID=2116657 RepID=A0A2P1NHN9_9BURK|nr:sensor domain-containing diguanylate cyclase [Pulveribacter suum]AVP56569.1 diguanylate cyclase [Pulveribacter suum]